MASCRRCQQGWKGLTQGSSRFSATSHVKRYRLVDSLAVLLQSTIVRFARDVTEDARVHRGFESVFSSARFVATTLTVDFIPKVQRGPKNFMPKAIQAYFLSDRRTGYVITELPTNRQRARPSSVFVEDALCPSIVPELDLRDFPRIALAGNRFRTPGVKAAT